VAVKKVCGIETEYGIHHLGGDNPVSSSSMLVSAYVADLERAGWDFEDESPGNDARGYTREGAMPPAVETHLVNAVLTSGARYYVDHAHPELSTPECSDALELVRYDKAGEEVLRRSMVAVNRILPDGQRITVYKNNSDSKGNSYGCHENYLMDRALPFARLADQVTSHFVTRQVYTGAGKVGSEAGGSHAREVTYQISQRSEFFEETIGLETTLKRPIVNTRDEPHADPKRYRRFHVIVGDANLCEVATFLKVGTTALVLSMIEDDALGNVELRLSRPVQAIRQISYDLSMREPVELVDGRTAGALDIQWELHRLARKYADERGLDSVGGEGVGREILRRWEEVLHGLETDPSAVARQVDWAAKLQLIEAYRDRHGIGWDDHRLAALDLQYHDLRPERSLFARLDAERLVEEESVMAAVVQPPRSTRAYFRGECLRRFPGAVNSANWDSLVFDVGTGPLQRVPMMDPLRGTAEHTEALLDGSTSASELLERLSAG
jgi:proteasome accessory factor A